MSATPSPDNFRDNLKRLHLVDGLFAHVTGHDLYLAEQIKEAIAFSLVELEQQTRDRPELAATYDAAFNAAAAALLTRFFQHVPRHGFFHWDAASSVFAATPLFARAELLGGLKSLATFQESTLLVTNLRPALLPADRRATLRRQQEYADTLRFVQDLIAARTRRSAQLRVLFL